MVLGTSFDFRRRMKWQAWLALIGFSLAIYFGYHAVNGNRGLLASQQLTDELASAEKSLAALQKEHATLMRNVKRLRSTSLDPDLIDELARESLSMVEQDDVIILLDREESTAVRDR